MKSKTIIYSGIFVILLLIGGIIYWYNTTKPTDSEINNATVKVEPVNSKLLDNNTSQQVQSREVFGNVPVDSSADYANTNPFK